MKVNASYTPSITPQQRPPLTQPAPAGGAIRDDAESKLRDLIALKHAEFDSFRPVEELGKHLDLRV